MSMKDHFAHSFVKLTREYAYGVIAGMGSGIMIGQYLASESPGLYWVLGSLMIAVGSTGAKLAQRDSAAAD